jgi:hypothetical protein
MERVQRIGAQTVVLVSKAVALKVAEAEACLEDTTTRLQRKVSNHLVRSLTVPETNPLFDSLIRLYTQGKRYPSLLSITDKKFGPTIGLTADCLIETVEAAVQEPWMEGIQGCRTRGLQGEEAEIIRRFKAGIPRNDKHTTNLLAPLTLLTPLNSFYTSILRLIRPKIYQQRYARLSKKMDLKVTRQTSQTRLNEVWKVMKSQRS